MTRRTQKNVGLLGLGIIGSRVAQCLRSRGFHVFVWNRTPRPVPNFVGSPRELADLADFIQIFVSDDDALMQMIEQMKRSLGEHHVVMAHCTVSPASMRAAAEIVHRRGGQFLDAPFTGSKVAAEKGELVYYVGGDDAAYRRARPVLEASSKEIIEVGDIGQATTIKIATNMVTAATVQTAAEALALVHNAGLKPETFAAAMRGNGSNSGTLGMKLPKMVDGDFDPHFSVKNMLKDVEIATRLGRSYGIALSATEAARDGLLAEERRGHGEDDYAAVIRNFVSEGFRPQPRPAEDQPVLEGLDTPAEPEAQLEPPGEPLSAGETRDVQQQEPPSENKAAEVVATNEEKSEPPPPENSNEQPPIPSVPEPDESTDRALPEETGGVAESTKAAGDQAVESPLPEATAERPQETTRPAENSAVPDDSRKEPEPASEKGGFFRRMFGRGGGE